MQIGATPAASASADVYLRCLEKSAQIRYILVIPSIMDYVQKW